MELRGMSDRIKKLRKQSEETAPYIFMGRATSMTDAYKKYEGGVSIPGLHALSIKEIFSRKIITTEGGELIVGDKGAGPQFTPTFPELCCHALGDIKVMNDRELICFKVNDGDMKQQEETTILFQEKCSTRHRIISFMSQEWKDCYEVGTFTELMKQRGPGHTVGSEKIYAKRFLNYQEDAEEAAAATGSLNGPKATKKCGELRSVNIMYGTIMVLGKHYATLARELAEKESDPVRKEELLQIAANCDTVPTRKPKTRWQATQMYWFIYFDVTTELNPWDAYSPGRPDQHLNPFYEADIEMGCLDKSKTKELLEYLQVKSNNQPTSPRVGIMLKESFAYTGFVNINIGGIAPDGEDEVGDVFYLILDVIDEMKSSQPSNNIQISKKTPMKFTKRAYGISRKGWGQPVFCSTEATIQELLNVGKSIEDARHGGASGCMETGAFGREACILQGYFNLSKILGIILYNGRGPVGGKQLGLQLGEAKDFESYDELFDAYGKQIEYSADIKVKGNNMITHIYAKYISAPLLSVITDDYITNGKDYNAGGARYSTNYLQGVDTGTITDSLSVIKYNVYDKKNFTMGELAKVLQDNFEGEKHVRLYNLVSRKTPEYGNDGSYTDAVMKEVSISYKNTITGRLNMRNGQWGINMLPATCRVYFGEVVLASPSDRLAYKPINEGISPEKAADVNGPTSVIRSVSKMDHLFVGGTPLNQKFAPSVVAREGGLSSMTDLIRSCFNMDEHHTQFNVIDRETLIKVQRNPVGYRDLIV